MTINRLKVLALGVALAVAPAAVANPLNFGAKGNSPVATPAEPAAIAAPAPAQAATNPEIEQADQKIGDLRRKVEQAKQQLEASRAHLKAAEAEYKAAQADKQALVLRHHARELASAAGVERPAQADLKVNDVAPAPAAAPAAPAPGATLQDLVP